MVGKSQNNNVNNIIHIVNDLKGLGLLQKRRRTAPKRNANVQQPRGLSGIERTVIDNSPQLRRDVQQIANERSILDERLKHNESSLNYLYDELDSGRALNRYISKSQEGISNIQSNSLRLPSLFEDYNKEYALNNDSINVPIVNASDSFKRPDEKKQHFI